MRGATQKIFKAEREEQELQGIHGYAILTKLREDSISTVYKGYSYENKRNAIFKIFRIPNPSPAEMAQIQWEYNNLKNVSSENIIRPNKIQDLSSGILLVFPDFDFKTFTLKEFQADKPLDLPIALQIAINVVSTLGEIHKSNIIHQSINPYSILIEKEIMSAKLWDFGITSIIDFVEGMLPYISPEQTGRMNRSIDYRTDFYSLGATFYEMLTGIPPFPTNNAIELIHSHIAKSAVFPTELNKNIPLIVSDIVMKLLSKNAEDRYQSASCLKSDLEHCLADFKQNKTVKFFPIAQNDLSGRFDISQKVYGRDNEIDSLLAAFDRVKKGSTETLMITGLPGVGKSVLVHEIHKPIIKQGGYFIYGKFEDKKNVPYGALIQAFTKLIRQILVESDEKIERWRKHLLESLGTMGRVIIDVIPELKSIIQDQPPLDLLGPLETRNRFKLVFQKFVAVFAQKEHPLVIFLDDLQLADIDSLNLIKVLLASDIKYLLFIGTYRDGLAQSHPLPAMLKDIREGTRAVSFITVPSLNIESVVQLIGDTFNWQREKSMPLVTFIYSKTYGNPFFIKELLLMLHRKSILSFNPTSGWEFDNSKVEEIGVSDNVVDLMVGKIAKLEQNTQELLKFAACLGNTFKLHLLAMIEEKSEEKVLDILQEAIQIGILVKLGDTYKFVHDRVQETAYSLLAENMRNSSHYKIGKALLSHNYDQPEYFFAMVHQLNLGISLVKDEEKYKLAELNLDAAKRAKLNTAYSVAEKYLIAGISLLNKDSWEERYELSFSLHWEKAESDYLNANFSEAEKRCETILEHAKSDVDKLKVFELKVSLDETRGEYEKAFASGIEGLKLCGVHFPRVPSKMAIFLASMKAKLKLRHKKTEDLLKLPSMSDRVQKAIMSLMMHITVPAYFIDKSWMALIAIKMLCLSLKYGNTDASSFAYVAYGIILCAAGKCQSGYEFGKLGLDVIKKFPHAGIQQKVDFMFAALINPWVKHIKESMEYHQRAFASGISSGDLNYTAYAKTNIVNNMLLQGDYLNDTYKAISDFFAFTQKNPHRESANICIIMEEMVFRLTGTTENYDEKKCLAQINPKKEKAALHFYYLTILKLRYLFGDYKNALEVAMKADAGIEEVFFGQINVAEQCFYFCLTLAALYGKASREEQKEYYKLLQSKQKRLEKWAKSCHENFDYQYFLVSAEIARILGQDIQAIELYNKAIQSANDNTYVISKGIAHELAGQFYLSKNMHLNAKSYLVEARYIYFKWGALAKAKHLEKQYRQIFADVPEIKEKFETGRYKAVVPPSISSMLDLNTIIKCSQDLSEEISPDKFFMKAMHTILENACAQKGLLILEKDGKWMVEAQGTIDMDGFKLLYQPASQEFPEAIINYVRRTMEDVVLADAKIDDRFDKDAYILKNYPKSVLSVPIVKQTHLIGILYLENNSSSNAFTEERLDILKTLSAQMAISLENAKLYSSLEAESIRRKELAEKLQKVNIQLDDALQKLYHSQRAIVRQERLRAMEETVCGIIHNLNNGLTPIVGFSSMLLKKNYWQSDPTTLEYYLKLIHSAALDVRNIVERLREFYRKREQHDVLALVKINEIIDEAAAFTEPKWNVTRPNGMKITVKKQLTEVPPIRGSQTELKEMLINLIFNAVDAMPVGGAITLRSYCFSKDSKDGSPTHVVIEVSDEGTGMTEEIRRRCMEPFFTTKGENGTGMGLAMTYGCVNRHEGTIDIETQLGKGTTFIIRLPISIQILTQTPLYKREILSKSSEAREIPSKSSEAREIPSKSSEAREIPSKSSEAREIPSKSSEAREIPSKSSGRLHVLLVDDNIITRELLKEWFKKENHSIETAEDGVVGLQKFCAGKFDIVITDKVMPKMKGDDLAVQIKQFSPHTPVIMLTGSCDKDEKITGPDFVLHKPVQMQELFQLLATISKPTER